jgi:hypothetical protein
MKDSGRVQWEAAEIVSTPFGDRDSSNRSTWREELVARVPTPAGTRLVHARDPATYGPEMGAAAQGDIQRARDKLIRELLAASWEPFQVLVDPHNTAPSARLWYFRRPHDPSDPLEPVDNRVEGSQHTVDTRPDDEYAEEYKRWSVFGA